MTEIPRRRSDEMCIRDSRRPFVHAERGVSASFEFQPLNVDIGHDELLFEPEASRFAEYPAVFGDDAVAGEHQIGGRFAEALSLIHICCAPLTVAQQSSTETPAAADAPQRKNRAGTHISLTGPSYPSVVVTPEGGHAVVMPPCGNTSVVVNPDGSHSIAIVNGSTATIVTP